MQQVCYSNSHMEHTSESLKTASTSSKFVSSFSSNTGGLQSFLNHSSSNISDTVIRCHRSQKIRETYIQLVVKDGYRNHINFFINGNFCKFWWQCEKHNYSPFSFYFCSYFLGLAGAWWRGGRNHLLMVPKVRLHKCNMVKRITLIHMQLETEFV